MKSYFFLFLFLSVCLFADKSVVPREQVEAPNPWFTGPLISPSNTVIPVGHYDIEPYFYFTANTAVYGDDWSPNKNPTLWTFTFEPALEFGLTTWMDIQFYPSLIYNYRDHQAKWGVGDPSIVVDFQLLSPSSIDDDAPYVKLVLSETFPVGKYRNLDPNKLGADITGAGTYQTELGIVLGRLLHVKGPCFFLPRIYFRYVIQSAAHIKGFSVYGGSYDTNGSLHPGRLFSFDFSFEFSLTKHWALACDLIGTWAGKTYFHGKRGALSDGSPAPIGIGSSAQFSLAPAIEYNWNVNLGVIAGGYFTFAGRNSQKFSSLVVALNYYH